MIHRENLRASRVIGTAIHQPIEKLETRTLFSTLTVNAAGGAMYTSVQTAIQAANANDTILVSPGNYVAQPLNFLGNQSVYFINKALTLKSTGGASVTTLTIPGSQPAGVEIVTSNVTVDGFTVSGGDVTVMVQDYVTLQGPVTSTYNETLKNLIVNAPSGALPANPGHGVLLKQSFNSVVDNVKVVSAQANGIFVDDGANNIVMNSTVQSTIQQHGIAVKNSTGNQIINNTITGAGFHGMLLFTASNNIISGNSVTGMPYDGITLTDSSKYNLVENNTIVNTPITTDSSDQGTCIFLNSESDYNIVSGNSCTNAEENGIALFKVSNNLIENNTVFNNKEGGILVWNYPDPALSVGNRPNQNVIVRNTIYDNRNNAWINLRDTSNTLVMDNWMSGANMPNGLTSGVTVQTSDNSTILHNTMADLNAGAYVYADSTGTTLAENRFFRDKFNYGLDPTIIAWDAGPRIGGNFYSNFTASGNPSSGTTPYTDIVYELAVGKRGGKNADHFPFASETLGQASSVTVTEPFAGTILTPGSIRTIRWNSTGAVDVGITISSASLGVTRTIAAARGNTGQMTWLVPADMAAAGDYIITVTPENSAGTAQSGAGTSSPLTVTTASGKSLKFISQGRDAKYSASQQVPVGFSATGTSSVAIEIQEDGGSWQLLATAAAGTDFATVTLPATTSNQARLRVRDTGSSLIDTMDGYFSIQPASTSAITSGPASNATVTIGSEQQVQWLSPVNTATVDVALIDSSTSASTALVSGMADLGNLSFITPDAATNTAKVRVTFKDSTGTVLSTADGNVFTIPQIQVASVFDTTVTDVAVTSGAYTTGQSLSVTATVGNNGTVASAAGQVQFILSTDGVLGNADDVVLGSTAVGAIGVGSTTDVTASLPLSSIPVNTYYVAAVVVAPGDAASTDNSFITPVAKISVSPGPSTGFDTFIDHLDFNSGVYTQAQTLTVSATLICQGLTNSGPTSVQFYLSSDDVLGDANDILIGTATGPSVAQNSSGIVSMATGFSLTSVPIGNYYVGAIVTSAGDTIPSNNSYVRPAVAVAVTAGPTTGADLTGSLATKGKTSFVGAVKQPTILTLQNVGADLVKATAMVSYYISDTSTLAGSATPFITLPAKLNLKQNKTAKLSKILTYPALADGTYYLIAKIDPSNAISETNEGNNTITAATPFSVAAPKVTLSMATTFPIAFVQGPKGKNAFALTLTNSGNTTATGKGTLSIFAAQDTVAGGPDDVLLGQVSVNINVKNTKPQTVKVNAKSLAGLVVTNETKYIFVTLAATTKTPDSGQGVLTNFSAVPIAFS